MKAADKIKQFFKDAELSINPDTDEKIFEDVHQAQQKSKEDLPALPENVWRITMKNPITKLTIAAVVTIACIIGVLMFSGTSGIALAEVLDQIEQVMTYRCRMSATFKNQDINEMPVTQATILISQTFGTKMNIEINHPLTGESMVQVIYMLPHKGTITTLMPNEKKYSQVKYDNETAKESQQGMNPQEILEQILKCEHTSLGRSTVDGIECEGFQTTDSGYAGGALGQATIKIWVDVETKLPVRMEVNKGEEKTGLVRLALTDFEWDVPVDAADFEPVIPDDYTPGRPMLQMLPPSK